MENSNSIRGLIRRSIIQQILDFTPCILGTCFFMGRCFFCARTSHEIFDGYAKEISKAANCIEIWFTVAGFIFVICAAIYTKK